MTHLELEPECTCERRDVDYYDASGCELCNPLSEWTRQLRESWREDPDPQLCAAACEIHCHHCQRTRYSMLSDGVFLDVESPVCCEAEIWEERKQAA